MGHYILLIYQISLNILISLSLNLYYQYKVIYKILLIYRQ